MIKKTPPIVTIIVILVSLALFSLPSSSTKPVKAQTGYPPPVITPQGNQGSTTRKVFLPLTVINFPPSPSNSFYMKTTYDVFGLGCSTGNSFLSLSGNHDIFVFLDFGVPNQDGAGDLGTVLYDQTPIKISEISLASFVFSQGFYYCNQRDSITISIGTNSSGGSYTGLIAENHGRAWANLVIDINQRISVASLESGWGGFAVNVKAVGGNNVEPGFNPHTIPDSWLTGYNSVTSSDRQFVYIIGSADGCPQSQSTNHNCNNGWTQENIYQVNWGSALSYPFPEIYNTTGANAQQWNQIGIYGNQNHSTKMDFKGEITQFGNCQQDPNNPKCTGADNSPATGFNQLYDLISGNNLIINSLKWSTDISYYNLP